MNLRLKLFLQGIFKWILLSKKLLRKHEETLKLAPTELFSDRALAAVQRMQSRETAPMDTWTRSTRALDIEADPSVFNSSASELYSLQVSIEPNRTQI